MNNKEIQEKCCKMWNVLVLYARARRKGKPKTGKVKLTLESLLDALAKGEYERAKNCMLMRTGKRGQENGCGLGQLGQKVLSEESC